MNDSLLSSARLNALLIPLMAYVGITFAWVHNQRLSLLFDARKAVVKEILAEEKALVNRILTEEEEKAPQKHSIPKVGLGNLEINRRIGESKTKFIRVKVNKWGGKSWSVTYDPK
jgi:hypothetical protein